MLAARTLTTITYSSQQVCGFLSGGTLAQEGDDSNFHAAQERVPQGSPRRVDPFGQWSCQAWIERAQALEDGARAVELAALDEL
jgi:hypothetical protein